MNSVFFFFFWLLSRLSVVLGVVLIGGEHSMMDDLVHFSFSPNSHPFFSPPSSARAEGVETTPDPNPRAREAAPRARASRLVESGRDDEDESGDDDDAAADRTTTLFDARGTSASLAMGSEQREREREGERSLV